MILFKYPKLLALLLSAIIIFFIAQIPHFELDASSDSLVLENDKDLLYYRKIQKQYQTNNVIVIAYTAKSGDLITPEHLQHLTNLEKQLEKLPLVLSVSSILDVPLFESPLIAISALANTYIALKENNASLTLAKKELTSSPFYADNIISLDSKTTAILVNIKPNFKATEIRDKRNHLRLLKKEGALSDTQQQELSILEKRVKENTSKITAQQTKLVDSVRRISQDFSQNADIFVGGLPIISTDIIRYIKNDLIVFSLGVILSMMVVLAIIFRHIRWVILPIIVSITAALVMTGILAFFNWKVTVISSNFFSLLLVMTLSVMIHLIVKYRELAQINPELSARTLSEQTLKTMFKPCLFTTLTTLVAFVSLLISGIRPVIDFGWMMSIGVSLALILAFLSFAVLMQLLPKIKVKKHQLNFYFPVLLAKLTERHSRLIVITTVLIFAISLVGITKLSVENRFIDYFKKDSAISQGLSLIDDKLGGTTPLEIIIDDWGYDYWYDEVLREDTHKIQNYLENLEVAGKVLSIDIPLQLVTRINENKPLSGFFLNVVRENVPEKIKKMVINPYISEESGQLRFVMRVRDTHPSLKRDALIAEVKAHLINQFNIKPEHIHLTGALVLYNNMLQSLFSSQIATMSVVFILIFIMFIVVFRSLILSIIALITNIMPSFLVLGTMGWLAIPLDLMTITIAAIAIGIGVDNAIHYIYRFKLEFQKDGDYLKTMHRSHRSIGLAIFYTSITVTLGFLMLTLSNFIPSVYFGVFTAIAMTMALLSNLTLLPKLILLIKPKITKF